MARLNIKSTKAAFLKKLSELEIMHENRELTPVQKYNLKCSQADLLEVANELGINIKPEDYK